MKEKRPGAGAPADDDSILDDAAEPEQDDAEESTEDVVDIEDVDEPGDDDGETEDADGEGAAEGDEPEGDEEPGDEPPAEGAGDDDDLPDDPKALKQIARQQARMLATIGAGRGDQPTTPAEDPATVAKNKRLERAFAELAKKPDSPEAIIIAELTEREVRRDEQARRERDVDDRLDVRRVPQQLRPIVRRYAIEQGVDPDTAYLAVVGALTLKAQSQRKPAGDKPGGKTPPVKKGGGAGGRTAGAGPTTTTLKPVRTIDNAAKQGATSTVVHNGFKMKAAYTDDEYSATLDRLERTNPAAARALFDAKSSGKVKLVNRRR